MVSETDLELACWSFLNDVPSSGCEATGGSAEPVRDVALAPALDEVLLYKTQFECAAVVLACPP
jgi:hypothetical protein